MTLVRTIFVAVVALSVAALPITSGMARAAMTHEASLGAPQTECCPHHEPCEKKTNDCGSAAGCAAKCFNFSGTVATPFVVAVNRSALEKTALIVPGLRSSMDNPPLPPPRA